MLETNIDRWEAHAIAQGMQQGFQQGIQRGILEGKLEGVLMGEAQALQRLLKRRFGNIPSAVADQMTNATQSQIETWFDAAIDAKSLDSIFGSTRH